MLNRGDTVKVHYTGKYLDGKVFDSTAASDPIMFTIGDEMMISSFEEAVMTMEEGEVKIIELKAKDAYGEYDPDLLVEVNRKEVFGDKELKVGDTVQAPTDEGVMVFKVHEVGSENVVLDANSELSGKDVVFEIELISVIKGAGYVDSDDIIGDFDDELNDGMEFDDDFDFNEY